MGCNIFVAHDDGLHKYWVIRISAKNPHKPPALNKRVMATQNTKVSSVIPCCTIDIEQFRLSEL